PSGQYLDRDVRATAQPRVVGQEDVAAGLNGCGEVQRVAELEVVGRTQSRRSVEYGSGDRNKLDVGASEERIEDGELGGVTQPNRLNPALQAAEIAGRDGVSRSDKGGESVRGPHVERPDVIEEVDDDHTIEVDQHQGLSCR